MDEYDPNWISKEFPQKKYDTITCQFVLNVVSEEEQNIIIEQLKSLLKPGGKCYITVKRCRNGSYEVKDSLREYTQRIVYLPFKTIFKNYKGETYLMEK
jgi:chemotaxis methyl-accepting protein methylase